MSREVKRVPMDFNWPQNKVWYGYLISTCHDDVGQGCDDCREYARLKGLELTSYDCPIFEIKDPPKGKGWQMWETTSEGSPISPVFETTEELARWLADTDASAFGGQTATYEQWLGMIQGPGWAPSAIADSKGLRSGIEAAADR